MASFPRTEVEGVSLPRLVIGSNWMRGHSHTSQARSAFIQEYQSRERIADILEVFVSHGVDAVISGTGDDFEAAVRDAEDRTGKRIIRIYTPSFSMHPGDSARLSAESQFDWCRENNCTICMPHQVVTDALLDLDGKTIRGIDRYTAMIRERGMIPGLSTHAPETIRYADARGVDAATYLQPYNAAGFLMRVEADWVMRVIYEARKPVMVIKPLAAGRLLPVVGLAFVWSTIRPQDMVAVGTLTPDEAREIVDLSLALIEHRVPVIGLQETRSKGSLKA